MKKENLDKVNVFPKDTECLIECSKFSEPRRILDVSRSFPKTTTVKITEVSLRFLIEMLLLNRMLIAGKKHTIYCMVCDKRVKSVYLKQNSILSQPSY